MSRKPSAPAEQRVRPLVGVGAGYSLLLADLTARIAAGEWKPGDQLPSERQLCDSYGVSRVLVRQALELGERKGLLVRVAGKGTFVARPRVVQELSRVTTFEATLAQHELAPVRQIVRSARELPPAQVVERLRVAASTPVLYLEVLGLADERPLALYESYLPSAIADAARLAEHMTGVLPPRWYDVLAERLGESHLVADQLYEVAAVDGATAATLGVPAGSPAFKVSTVFATPADVPVEARVAIYPGSHYAFHLRRALTDQTVADDG